MAACRKGFTETGNYFGLWSINIWQECCVKQARTSMVDGFPYKEEVGGSSPSVPTRLDLKSQISDGH
jgi:hypothetical protein